MIIAPAFMLFEDTDEYRSFFAVICFGLFVLNFCRRANAKNVNSTLMSAASAVICSAIYIQPFFRIEDEILRHKFNLIPLLLFAFSIRMIWRGKSKAAREVGFAVNVLAFACLIWDALYFDDVFNTLCVLSASLVLLMWSYAMKKKRWFGISLCALVGVTVYAMRDYFGLLDWWVYLLLVGILLIFVAAMNEYFKSKGESVKTKAGKFFDEWKNWD
jgi:hypothetical protein